MMSRLSLSILFSASIAGSMLLSSCGSTRHFGATVYKTTPVGVSPSKPDRKNFEIPSTLAPQSHALLAETRRWIGTPYKYGGEDRNGVDCSGLVLNVYRSALNLKLPRNSAKQADFCQPLSKNALMPGDLLFFDTTGGNGSTISHVGIYVGDGKMVHSSVSKGVIVSDINEDYFKKTFAGAGYVEKYRDMIASNTSGPRPASAPQQAPTVSPSSAGTVQQQPFTLTPVNSLPERKTPQSLPPVVSRSVTQPAVIQATPGTAVAEPTADEARKKVLNSLIEQKLDSIFNR